MQKVCEQLIDGFAKKINYQLVLRAFQNTCIVLNPKLLYVNYLNLMIYTVFDCVLKMKSLYHSAKLEWNACCIKVKMSTLDLNIY